MLSKSNPSSKGKQKWFQYSLEELNHAIEEVRAGRISANKASLDYGIPKGTLIKKLHSNEPISRKMGPSSVLLPDEETRIESWILGMAKIGFPLHAEDVKDTVQRIMKDSHRDNPFANDRPGKKWFKLFLNRHPDIVKRNAEILSRSRANVSEEGIKEWFAEIEKYLESENASDILNDSSRIFNLDETGMSTCPKTGKILGPKGYRNLYSTAPGPEKESITVLCNFSAAGDTIDPMIIYPYKRIPRDVAESVPNHVAIGRSDSGWMVSATFFEYIANIFHPWLQNHNVKRPVILFLDGHKSHVNEELHTFCVQNQILLFCLLPNATHILQPCDVGIFKPLKTAWGKVVRMFKQEENKAITKVNFANLFCKSFSAITKESIVNSFKACGIFPFNPENVDYSKCISKRRKDLCEAQSNTSKNETDTSKVYSTAIQVIEFELGSETLDLFKQAQKQKTEVGNDQRMLFQLWETLRQKSSSDENAETPQNAQSESNKENVMKKVLIETNEISKQPRASTSSTREDPWDHHLQWPKPPKHLKRKREKVPFAACSQEWKNYHDHKVKVKEEKEEGVKRRKKEREEKRNIDIVEKENRKEEKKRFNEWLNKKNEEIKMKLSMFKKL